MGKLLAILLVKAAEGEFGSGVKSAYWKLAGKKTWISIVLFAVAGGLSKAAEEKLCVPCGDLATQVTLVIAFVTMMLGQVDGAVRVDPPKAPDEFVKIPAP